MPGWLLCLYWYPGSQLHQYTVQTVGNVYGLMLPCCVIKRSLYYTCVVGYLGNADGGQCVYVRHSKIQLVLHNKQLIQLLHDPAWYNILYTREKMVGYVSMKGCNSQLALSVHLMMNLSKKSVVWFIKYRKKTDAHHNFPEPNVTLSNSLFCPTDSSNIS